MATAMEYVFEQGSSGTVQCIPPSDKADVTMTQFKQDLTILWVAVANGAASSVSPNRFTASYSYRKTANIFRIKYLSSFK